MLIHRFGEVTKMKNSMKTSNKNKFKAVDFMRKVREELSNLYNTDKKRYFEEIKKAMEEFKAREVKAYH